MDTTTRTDAPPATLPRPTAALDGLPVVVIGAGPVGLAAAAHLADRRLPFVVLEAGATPGAAVRAWGHVRTFTPWTYIVDATAEQRLAAIGWAAPDTAVPPTGDELATHYLEPLAASFGDRVRLGHRVTAVARDGMDKAAALGRADRPFVVRVRDAAGRRGEVRARAVIDASGTWAQPNPLGASGLPALGEDEAGDAVVGPLPDVQGRDRDRFAGRTTLVVGAGHSAATTLLDLGRLAAEVPGTRILWAIRAANPARVYGGEAADDLAARGLLGSDLRRLVESGAVTLVTGFRTTELVRDSDTVTVVGATASGPVHLAGVHTVVTATGFRPDLALLAELRLDLDPGLEAPRALGPLIDPAFHSCGTVPPHGHRDLAHPEPGLYVVGTKSYGRAPTFLITTGNEQVRSVVAALAGDTAAADDVRLVLPETGVCSVSSADGGDVPDGGGARSASDGAAVDGFHVTAACCGPTGIESLTGPATAHREPPVGASARGFASGVGGGGRAAEQGPDRPGPTARRMIVA